MLSDYFKDVVEKALREELVIVNKHMPYKRFSLCELLNMQVPHYVSRDGSLNLIDRRELELLKSIVGKGEDCNLYLPIIIEYKPSFGEGVFMVRDRVASIVVSRILGLEEKTELVIYRPQVFELRSRLKTTTTIIFLPE